MFKRQIAIGDIHGCYNLLVDLIGNINFNPSEDQLIFLGDYIDRGPKSYEVVAYLCSLKAEYPNNIVLLKGNHEEMAYSYLTDKTDTMALEHWIINGGAQTINSHKNSNACIDALVPFIEKLEVYYETDNHIFVHAGIPRGKTPQTTDTDTMLWGRDFSYDGDKTVIVGHTIHHRIRNYNKTICIDTGAFYHGRLTGYNVLNNEEYFVV